MSALFVILIVLGVLLGFVPAGMAKKEGRSFLFWLLLPPLVSFFCCALLWFGTIYILRVQGKPVSEADKIKVCVDKTNESNASTLKMLNTLIDIEKSREAAGIGSKQDLSRAVVQRSRFSPTSPDAEIAKIKAELSPLLGWFYAWMIFAAWASWIGSSVFLAARK